MNADEPTAAAEQLSPLDKLGSALVKQLMKVVDEGVGPVTASRDYAEARLAPIVREINKRVGFMLVAKYGTKRSVVTLAKLVPASAARSTPRSLGSWGVWQGNRSPHWRRRLMWRNDLGQLF